MIRPFNAKIKAIVSRSSEARVPKLLVDLVVHDIVYNLSRAQLHSIIAVLHLFHQIHLRRYLSPAFYNFQFFNYKRKIFHFLGDVSETFLVFVRAASFRKTLRFGGNIRAKQFCNKEFVPTSGKIFKGTGENFVIRANPAEATKAKYYLLFFQISLPRIQRLVSKGCS